MKKMIFLLLTLMCHVATAQSDYQELTYQDLLNELQTKTQTVVSRQTSDLDDVKLLLGIGFAQSTSRFFVNNQEISRTMSGIQLSVGVDLFSQNWYSEGVFKNFGLNSSRVDSFELREFILRLGFKDKVAEKVAFNLSSGLSTRYLEYKDRVNRQQYNPTTPSLTVSAGVRIEASPFASLGLEASARNALVRDTIDRESFDLLIKMEAAL